MSDILLVKYNNLIYYGRLAAEDGDHVVLYGGTNISSGEAIDVLVSTIINYARGTVTNNTIDISDTDMLRFSVIDENKVKSGDAGAVLKALKNLDPYNVEIDNRLYSTRKFRVPKRIPKHKQELPQGLQTYLGMDKPGSLVYILGNDIYLVSSVQAIIQGRYEEITRLASTIISIYLGLNTTLKPIALSCNKLELPSTFYSGDNRTKALLLLNQIKHLCRSVGLQENMKSVQFLEDNLPDNYGDDTPQEFGDVFIHVTPNHCVYAGAPAFGWLDLGSVKTLTDRRELTKSTYKIVSFILGMTSPEKQEIPAGKNIRLCSDDLVGDKAQSWKEQQVLQAVRDAV